MVTLKAYDQLIISASVEKDLIKYFYRGVHENMEFCGIIAGQIGVASKVIEIPNLRPENSITYEFDPIAFNTELNRLDQDNLELLALFHTHPPGALALSQKDVEDAKLNVAHIVVSSTMKPDDYLPKVEYKGWLIKDKKPEEINMIVPYRPVVEEKDNTKSSGIVISVSAQGLSAFVQMIDVYFGGARLRSENFDLREGQRNMRRSLRQARRGARRRDPNSPGSLINTGAAIVDRTMSAMDPNRFDDGDIYQDPDELAENEMEIERLMEGGPMHLIGDDENEPKTAPAQHKHKYEWVSDTPDGMTILECNFPDCNKQLTVNGDIVPGKPTPIDPPVPFVDASVLITPIGEKTVVCLDCGGEAIAGHSFCKDCITQHGLPDTTVKKEDTVLGPDEEPELDIETPIPAYCWGCGQKTNQDTHILNGYCGKCTEEGTELIMYCSECGDLLFKENGKCEKCNKIIKKEDEKDGANTEGICTDKKA